MKKLQYFLGALVVAGGLWFAYYAISPVFINIKVDEQIPVSTQKLTEKEFLTEINNPAPIIGTVGHPASGTVRVVEGDGKKYLRYENFKTINGPDIFVYLATDKDAKDFVNLGMVKATEGNINYEIPTNTDLNKYHHALVWCKAFGVLFNYADLNEIGD